MKQFTVILILISLLASNFSRVRYYADYQFNKAEYIKNCENKAKPKMNCKGHCQLSKKLKQEDSKDAQQPERRSSLKEEVLSSKTYFNLFYLTIIDTKLSYANRNNNNTVDFSTKILRPPQLI